MRQSWTVRRAGLPIFDSPDILETSRTGKTMMTTGRRSIVCFVTSRQTLSCIRKASSTMTSLDEQFEDLYGPLAPFSDFKKGEHITYRSEGQTRTGTIVWVATATRIAGRDIPVQYIVECDQHSGFPDNVWQSDIVMDPQA